MTTTTKEATDEASVRHVIDQWVKAFRDKSTAAAMALHAPGIVSFDIVPPLRYVGTTAYSEAWDAAFDSFTGPIILSLSDLHLTVRDDLAYSRSLNRFQATTSGGREVDYWFRWTAVFQKIGGKWLIVHDHTSLPTEFSTGEARQDLVP